MDKILIVICKSVTIKFVPMLKINKLNKKGL